MYLRSLVFVLATFCCTEVCAQENWDVYMALLGDKPASIMVDMGSIDRSPDHLLPYVLVTGPKAKNCTDKNGLPSTMEIDDMEKVLDVTGSILSGVTAKRLVGTVTSNCERLNYYYIKDTTGIRNALVRMYGKHFPDRTYTLRMKQDVEWLAYRNFLYPDSAAREWMASDKIIARMRKGGDDLSRPRDIQHTLYFMSDAARRVFADSARAHHFNISNNNAVLGFDKRLYEVTVSRYGGVRIDSILAAEADLKNLAAPLGGTYRTWIAPLAPQSK